MKKLLVAAVIVLIIASVTYLYIINRFDFTKTSWQVVNGFISNDNDERLLFVLTFYKGHKVDYQSPIFIHDDTIRLYSNIEKEKLLQEFKLPGKFQSFQIDTLRDSKNLYFTVNDNGKSKLVIYEYKDDLYKILSNMDIDYKIIEYSYSKPGSQGSDDTLTLISKDRCKIQLFEPAYKPYFEFKHDRPFMRAEKGVNYVFDGERIFSIYKPEETIKKFDYSGIEFDPSLLDFNKNSDMGPEWLYNNGYLVMFDPNTYKATSVTKIDDIIYMYYYKSPKPSDEILSGYFYITKDGVFITDLKKTKSLFPAHDMNKENIIYGAEYNFVLYTMSDGNNTKFISVKGIVANYKIEELGSVPGRFLGAYLSGGFIYAYTTEGVFRNHYPHFEYLESRQHP